MRCNKRNCSEREGVNSEAKEAGRRILSVGSCERQRVDELVNAQLHSLALAATNECRDPPPGLLASEFTSAERAERLTRSGTFSTRVAGRLCVIRKEDSSSGNAARAAAVPCPNGKAIR